VTGRALFPNPLHRRLAPLVAASFFGGVALWVPVEKLFLAEIGFTPQTIGLMAAAYAAVVPLLEIPSGILADRWSRRGVLMLGNAGAFLSVLVGGLSGNVAAYLGAALLLGVYFAMQSGTFDAIVYDTVLEETGDSERFESIVGRVRMVESASLVLGALGGGALAAVTAPRTTYFATLPFLVMASVCLLYFREPRLHATSGERSLRQHVAVTFEVIRQNRQLRPVVALLVLTSILTQAVFEFGPLWLVESGTGAGAFGPAWAGLMASIGLGGALAGRVRFESSRTLALVVALLLASASTLLVTSHAAVVTGAQIVVAVLSVAMGIFLTRLLHDSVPSDVRAGVASGVGAATWGTFLPFALGFGVVTERWGVQVAGGLVVLIVLAIAALVLPVARRTAAAEAIPGPLVPVSTPVAA
jgi:predicted MFS family arabinose efflux permease